MTQSRHSLLALSLAILTAGFLGSEAAVTLPLLLSELGLSASEGGWVISVRFLGGTGASLLLIAVGNRVSFRGLLLLSVSIILASTLLLPFVDGYVPLLVASFVRGISLTLLIAVTNAALSAWFWKNPGRWAAYVHAWFGVGLIAAPIAGFLSVSLMLGWRTVWAVAGLLGIVVGFSVLALPATRDPRGIAGSLEGLSRRASPAGRLPSALWVLPVAIAVFNVGIEGSIIGWVPSFVVINGASARAGQFASLLLASGIVAGRLLATRLARRNAAALLYHSSLLAVGSLALFLILLPSLRTFVAPALGFGMSAMYPTMVSRFGARARRSGGRLYAATELAATLGGVALPALIGALSDFIPQYAFPSVILGALFVLIALSALFEREEQAGLLIAVGRG